MTAKPPARGARQIRRYGTWMTYSNVVATVCLFLVLGGGAYAAATLPAGSVGPQQLRAGAVGLRALSFPLAAASIVDNQPEQIGEGGCNGGGRGGPGPAPPCPQAQLTNSPRRELKLSLSAAGRIFVSDTVTVTGGGSSATRVVVTLAATVDGHVATRTEVTVSGGETIQVPLQALVQAAPGPHVSGVGTAVAFESPEPGTVAITNVSAIALAVPQPAHSIRSLRHPRS